MNKAFKRIAFILAIPLAASIVLAATGRKEPALSTLVDKKTIRIGDRIRYTLELRSDEALEAEFPKFDKERLDEFEIKNSGGRRSKPFFAGYRYLKWYEIATFSVGKQLIKPCEVRYKRKGETGWSILKSAEITINVESVLPNNVNILALDIKDIKGPLYFLEINKIIMAAALALLALYLASLYIRRMMRNAAPKKSPYETAVGELAALKRLLAAGMDIKECYAKASFCVRDYIEETLRLRAPEMTTEEFLNSLKDSPHIPPQYKVLFKEFLEACDFVKFAKYTPTGAEIESVFRAAENLIEKTKELSKHAGEDKS
jgi:hypothetical protein